MVKSRVGNLRAVKAFYSTRDLLLSSSPPSFFFFNDRYAPTNSRNDSHLLAKTFLWSLPSIQPKKGLNFLRRSYCFFVFFLSSPLIRPKHGLNFWQRPFFFGSLEWWRPAANHFTRCRVKVDYHLFIIVTILQRFQRMAVRYASIFAKKHGTPFL